MLTLTFSARRWSVVLRRSPCVLSSNLLPLLWVAKWDVLVELLSLWLVLMRWGRDIVIELLLVWMMTEAWRLSERLDWGRENETRCGVGDRERSRVEFMAAKLVSCSCFSFFTAASSLIVSGRLRTAYWASFVTLLPVVPIDCTGIVLYDVLSNIESHEESLFRNYE